MANEIGICVTTILAWLMTVDGDISKVEKDFLIRISPDTPPEILNYIIKVVQSEDLGYIRLACEAIKKHLDRERKELFFRHCSKAITIKRIKWRT